MKKIKINKSKWNTAKIIKLVGLIIGIGIIGYGLFINKNVRLKTTAITIFIGLLAVIVPFIIVKLFRMEPKKPKIKNRGKRFLILLMYLMIGFISLGVAFFIYVVLSSPDFNPENLYNKEATIIYDIKGEEIAKIGMENRETLTYDELPNVLVDAIVATEDSRYFEHNGFDIARFAKAFLGQLGGNSSAGGGSTLTMQVAKNAYTDYRQVSGIKGILRKATDIYIAIFKLEKVYTKEEIIEFYVNTPWLGNRSWGVEQACQTYFGKSVKDLSLTEAAIIAGMFQAPASYNPFNSTELTSQRRGQVLNLMVRHGYITEEQADEAKSIPVASLLTNQQTSGEYQAFVDTVVEEVEDKTGYDPYFTPMLIYTTMEKSAQDSVNKIMNGESIEFVNDVIQMGIAVTNVETGAISAIGAGRNRVGERQLNYATQINRHPGSTAKPFFAYGPLIEYENASTYTPFFDEKYTYSNGGSIVNADRKYLGLISMRYALAKSRNIPALQAFQQNDLENIANFVHSLGIDYGKDLFESAATGGFNGLNPLTMSAAYGTFARGGYYVEPYSYTKIILRETDETLSYKPTKEKVMGDDTAYMMNYMLQSAITEGALGSAITVSGTDIAAKTGTSSIDASFTKKYGIPSYAINDSWFDIYSPDYSISMWYGYKTLSKDYYLTNTAANKVRNKVANILAKGIFPKDSTWSKPSSVTMVDVERETFPAKLASVYTPADLVTREAFKSGTEPVDISTRFDTLANPTNLKTAFSNGTITITWDKIDTPDAISTVKLQEYFNTYYSDWAEQYYNERLTYNTNFIGTLGYQLYLKSSSGNLTPLAYTNNNSYTYLANNSNTDYTFVVKSAYSIFKDNMSTGVSITANPYDLTTEVSFKMIEDPTKVSISSGNYTDLSTPFTMKVNGIEVNNFTYTSKIYKINGDEETEVTKIPLNTSGTYKISYIVTYNSKKYNPTRKVIVE